MAQDKTTTSAGKNTGKKKKTVPIAERRKQAAEKKAAQRAAKRARGLREITVWCLPEQADQVREFADSLPQPPEGSTPEQVQRFRDDQLPILKAINETNDKLAGQSDEQARPEH